MVTPPFSNYLLFLFSCCEEKKTNRRTRPGNGVLKEAMKHDEMLYAKKFL
jgi:hypothetical protein